MINAERIGTNRYRALIKCAIKWLPSLTWAVKRPFNTPINFDTDTLGGIKTSKCTWSTCTF